MRRGYVSIFLVLGSIWVCICSPGCREAREPVLEMDDVFDLGEAKHEQAFRVRIPFRNGGDFPLKIERVLTCCGTTALDVPTKKFPRGEEGAFLYECRMMGPPGTQAVKSFVVCSNDPVRPRYKVRVRAWMAAGLAISPAAVVVEDLRPNEAWTRELFIVGAGSNCEFNVNRIASDLAGLSISIRRVRRSPYNYPGQVVARAYRVTVGQTRVRVVGEHCGHIRIQTDFPGSELLAVPVSVRVHSEIDVEPRFLLFHTYKDAAVRSACVSLKIKSPVPIRIVPRITEPGILVRCATSKYSKEWLFTCFLNRSAPGTMSGRLTFDIVGYEYQSSLVVPFATLTE